ncbi:MAG: hypothetical protein FWG71_00245 [Synergistaceae bacterium]|nr:hypothetical protein [Synergistaceae bacterium]
MAYANSFEDTIRILEDRTAFHWGRDCFVWVVHYSEHLVDPWVESEAGRVGMTAPERAAYKESFISDLSIGQAEPVLVTVHAFGVRPLDFSPFSEKISLVTRSGERVKPERYDRILDQPLSGVVQGLVFFPKQSDADFAIAIRGLGVYDERIFSFAGDAFSGSEALVPEPEEEAEIVVVELPPAPARSSTTASRPQTRSAPQPPPPPPPPPPPLEPVRTPEPAEESVEPEEPEISASEPEDVAYSSREQVLRTFLTLWIKFDPEEMYSMLSDSSRKQFSLRTFEAELRRSQDFRSALRDGYTIDWTDTERGRVVAVKRILIIRTLLSRTFGVIREDSDWKIVW